MPPNVKSEPQVPEPDASRSQGPSIHAARGNPNGGTCWLHCLVRPASLMKQAHRTASLRLLRELRWGTAHHFQNPIGNHLQCHRRNRFLDLSVVARESGVGCLKQVIQARQLVDKMMRTSS
jgi:hypothetical protein